jgi:hypothetical protein
VTAEKTAPTAGDWLSGFGDVILVNPPDALAKSLEVVSLGVL